MKIFQFWVYALNLLHDLRTEVFIMNNIIIWTNFTLPAIGGKNEDYFLLKLEEAKPIAITNFLIFSKMKNIRIVLVVSLKIDRYLIELNGPERFFYFYLQWIRYLILGCLIKFWQFFIFEKKWLLQIQFLWRLESFFLCFINIGI